jgi:competence protein ComEC
MKKNLIWVLVLFLLTIRFYFFFKGHLKYPDGTKVKIKGTVTSEPLRYPTSQRITLGGYAFFLTAYPEVGYRDNVVVIGTVEGNNLKDVSLVSVRPQEGLLYKFRNKIISFYQRNLPQNHAALVSGMTLGSKKDIGKDFWTQLKNSGTAHVIVASGMNVTLVASFLMSFLVVIFPRRRAIPLALVGIWTYALISGFDAPIIRAAVMGSIAFSAQELGKVYSALRALIISGATLLFVYPNWLTDLGFILSFVATLSLIIFVPKLEKLLKFLPKILKEDLVTTLSAQIGVTPILYFYFGQFNILSPLINVLVLWTVVPITIIGMISGIIGTIFEPLGRLLLLITYPLTGWFIKMVTLFSFT